MKKIVVVALITVAILLLINFAMDYINQKNNLYKEDKLITIKASTPDEAAVSLSERLFKNGNFADVSISDFQILDYIQLNEYKELTTNGRVFSYEFIYKFKTDDNRAFMDNKITGEPVATNVWLDDVIVRRCIVLFEYENVYYKLFNWDEISFNKNFIYNNGEYGGSNTSPKDWLECNIIREVFDNKYNIAELKISENPPTESIKNKLLRDIEMFVSPEYTINKTATKVYNLTFNNEAKCIYFNADLYDEYGNEIVKSQRFSLHANQGFSIYDIENIVPKSIEKK